MSRILRKKEFLQVNVWDFVLYADLFSDDQNEHYNLYSTYKQRNAI